MKEFKDRIFKNWKTTLIGIVVFAISSYALLNRLISGSEYAMLLPTVLMLFRVKDTVLGAKLGNKQ